MICQVFCCYPMQRELVTNLIYDHLANWAWECTRKQDSSTKIFNSKWLYDWTHPKTSSGYFPFEHTPEALRQEYPDGLTVVTILDEFDDILCATLNSGLCHCQYAFGLQEALEGLGGKYSTSRCKNVLGTK